MSAVLLSACGGDGAPAEVETAEDQFRELPLGYEYAPAPVPAAPGETFEDRVREGFGAQEVVLRDAYNQGRFVAELIVARTDEPPPVEKIADVVMPGRKTPPRPVTFGEREAQRVDGLGRNRARMAVIDTFGPYVLVVISEDPDEVLTVAEPNVR